MTHHPYASWGVKPSPEHDADAEANAQREITRPVVSIERMLELRNKIPEQTLTVGESRELLLMLVDVILDVADLGYTEPHEDEALNG